MKVALIGFGGIAPTHLAQWRKFPVTPVAAADPHPAAYARAEQEGLRPYRDWRQMLDEMEPQIVSICTPPAFHAEIAMECLRRSIHVLCEKPMEATLEPAEMLAEAARQASAKLMIAYCHRFHGPILRLKALLEEGRIGRPYFFRGAFTGFVRFAGNHRANQRLAGGGALMDNGSHAVDLYTFLIGPVARVSCRAATCLQKEMETDDVALLLLTGEKNCFGEIIVGYSLPAELTDWMIVGEGGILRLADYFSGPVLFRPHESTEWQPFPCDNTESRFDRMFQHFWECVQQDKEPLSNAETALHVQRVIARAYEEARTPGRPV